MDSDLHSIFTVWARNDAAAALDAILEWNLSGSMNPWFGFSQLAAMDAHRHTAFELVLAINDKAARQKGLESNGTEISLWMDDLRGEFLAPFKFPGATCTVVG